MRSTEIFPVSARSFMYPRELFAKHNSQESEEERRRRRGTDDDSQNQDQSD